MSRGFVLSKPGSFLVRRFSARPGFHWKLITDKERRKKKKEQRGNFIKGEAAVTT